MPPSTPSPQSPRRRLPVSRRTVAGLGAIALTVDGIALAFAGTAGWLSPARLSGADLADVLARPNVQHPGFRPAHTKRITIVRNSDSTHLRPPLSMEPAFPSGGTRAIRPLLFARGYLY